MAISNFSDAETQLLEDDDAAAVVPAVVHGCVDYRGLPANRSASGGWRSAGYIISVEIAERFVYFGIESNLITYLTGPLGQSTAAAAENVNVWSGTASLLPLLGGFVADSFLGRYWTIVAASLIYVLGLSLLTLSVLIPSYSSSDCQNTNNLTSCSPNMVQVVLFFFSLYLVAIGQSGHKPCIQAFGADQFDGQDPEECKARSSFFNWWYFGTCGGGIFTVTVLSYIQDNLSWGLGFGIPCIFMVAALVIFLLGTKTYRYSLKSNDRSAFVRIGRVFVAAIRNWKITTPTIALEEETHGTLPHLGVSEQYKFLNKALLGPDGSKKSEDVCCISEVEVEEAKACFSLVPIWMTCLMYAIVFAQPPTFFTKQGATLDRSVTPGFNIPSASLLSLIDITTLLTIPIYDRVFVPITRAFGRKPAGITVLQRIGIGMFLSTLCMVVAALVEMKRLKTAEEYGLVDEPNMTIPMSIWWLLPQYVLFGVSDVFTMVGLQEFFYKQVPADLRSVGLSLYLSIFGVGSFLSSVLVSTIDKATSGNGRYSWFSNNLNHGHLDHFYWLLAGLSAIELVAYLYFAKSVHIYNK